MKPRPPKRFLHRRLWAAGMISALIAGLLLLISWQEQNLWHSAYATGYCMIGSLFFLASYHWRKKVPVLPALGSSRLWMQLHIYVGFASIAIFATHISWRMPLGYLEQFLTALYVIVAASGLYGLYTTRTVPRRLTAINNEVIFEQIPMLRAQLVQRVRQLVLQSSTQTEVLAKFYVNHLAGYFERPRSVFYLMAPTLRRSRQLIAEISELDRYLSKSQRAVSRQVSEMVKQKEDLDYHFAMQGRLKLWLFVHIGLTYGLLIVAVLHGVMAHAFGGGLR